MKRILSVCRLVQTFKDPPLSWAIKAAEGYRSYPPNQAEQNDIEHVGSSSSSVVYSPHPYLFLLSCHCLLLPFVLQSSIWFNYNSQSAFLSSLHCVRMSSFRLIFYLLSLYMSLGSSGKSRA